MSFWLGTFAFLVLAAASLFATRFVGARAGRAKLRYVDLVPLPLAN